MAEIAIFSPNSGILYIKPGSEDEFVGRATSDVKDGLIRFNALAIVALKFMDSLYPLIVPPSADFGIKKTADLKAGIMLCIGNVDNAAQIAEEAVQFATEQFKAMNIGEQVSLCMKFM